MGGSGRSNTDRRTHITVVKVKKLSLQEQMAAHSAEFAEDEKKKKKEIEKEKENEEGKEKEIVVEIEEERIVKGEEVVEEERKDEVTNVISFLDVVSNKSYSINRDKNKNINNNDVD